MSDKILKVFLCLVLKGSGVAEKRRGRHCVCGETAAADRRQRSRRAAARHPGPTGTSALLIIINFIHTAVAKVIKVQNREIEGKISGKRSNAV